MKKRKTRSLFVLEIVMLFLSILIIAPCLMMIKSFKEQCADGVDDCSGSRDFICSVLVCSC